MRFLVGFLLGFAVGWLAKYRPPPVPWGSYH